MLSQVYWSSFLIVFLINFCFFLLAAIFKTDKVTDLSYGLSFIFLTLYLIIRQPELHAPQIIVAVLIILWGIRLAGYLFIRILKIKRDSRFNKIRNQPLEFAKFWFFQIIAVWVIMLPAITILNLEERLVLEPLMILGAVIAAAGLLIESIADWEKFNFKNKASNKNRWIQSGLWQYSRHPNYFGEITFWWGLFLIVSSTLSNWQWLTIIGPFFIAFILIFVTGIPPLEKRYQKKYADDEDYRRYREATSVLVPLPKKSKLK